VSYSNRGRFEVLRAVDMKIIVFGICKVMCFSRMTQKMGYFIHMAVLCQMEFNSVRFFFARRTVTVLIAEIGQLMIS
jgi:hypothetical protein